MGRIILVLAVAGLAGWLLQPATVESACCYFSAKDKDINQPAQKVFITWDPEEQVETFTVQPKFEGNATDFGMVIPTPARPIECPSRDIELSDPQALMLFGIPSILPPKLSSLLLPLVRGVLL